MHEPRKFKDAVAQYALTSLVCQGKVYAARGIGSAILYSISTTPATPETFDPFVGVDKVATAAARTKPGSTHREMMSDFIKADESKGYFGREASKSSKSSNIYI